jgi:large subunit ribosomal protein L5
MNSLIVWLLLPCREFAISVEFPPKGLMGVEITTSGLKSRLFFPEIEYDKIDVLRGMNISITTTAKTDDEARALLAAFKFPFKS